MEINNEEVIALKEGLVKAEIVSIIDRQEPYKYTDFVFKVQEHNVDLKHGFPTKIAHDKETGEFVSGLGKFLFNLGILEKGQEKCDPELAIGKKVQFYIKPETKDDKTYFNIVADTIKLL